MGDAKEGLGVGPQAAGPAGARRREAAVSVTRDFAVATFVVHRGRVLLLHHAKLSKWLPPGGHIEPHELPDEAAVREVREEAGIDVRLVGERALPVDDPRQLIIPRGVQVETIAPGHEHIDLVYFAVPVGDTRLTRNREALDIGWFTRDELEALPLTREIRLWTEKALAELGAG
ncbi:MAG: NUDIX hydrolase [Firmicutes bacterium]|nr:NUDIX hydrolase [Bacillota bacterium]MBO2522008.1 NUDIX hydrolase [Bacillota bacterium]